MIARVFLIALVAVAAFGVEVSPEAAALSKQMTAAEKAIDRHFRAIGSGETVAMIGTARGIYLADYGAVFSVEVNLIPMANLSPFRSAYTEEEKRQLNVRKRQRMETLEQQMREVLMKEGAGLSEVGVDQHVALAVSLFHFPWEDLTQLPSQVVMAGARGELGSRESLTTRYY